MRIIAGEFRGRQLLAPISDTTRPITDRAKQSLFDVLAPLIEGSTVYDCFAGTGSMGLECLSRGARQTVFFEKDREALKRLQSNISALQVTAQSIVVSGDVFKSFGPSQKWLARAGPADLFFLDPPYRFLRECPDALTGLLPVLLEHHLKSDSTVIFRHDSADSLELPGLRRYDQREYGRMLIELLRPDR